MRELILDGYSTPELEEIVTNHAALPLVRELTFTYGLRVSGESDNGRTLYLSYQNGINVAAVFIGTYIGRASNKENNEGIKQEEKHYALYTPHSQKSRGRSTKDKSTYHSKKLSALMSTLKKNEVIPSMETATKTHCLSVVINCIERAEHTIRKGANKGFELQPENIHELLKALFDNTPVVDMGIYKTVLDKYDEADRINEKAVEKMHSMYSKAFYVVGANRLNQLMVGIYKADSLGPITVSPIQPIKRVENLEEYPELLGVMTMYKVAKEGDSTYDYGGYIPSACRYDENFELSFDFDCSPSEFDYVWAVTPCSENYSRG